MKMEGCFKLTDAAVALAGHCPGSTSVNLGYCPGLTDAAIVALVEHCPSLISVGLGAAGN